MTRLVYFFLNELILFVLMIINLWNIIDIEAYLPQHTCAHYGLLSIVPGDGGRAQLHHQRPAHAAAWRVIPLPTCLARGLAYPLRQGQG